jgi:hypothetical protein
MIAMLVIQVVLPCPSSFQLVVKHPPACLNFTFGLSVDRRPDGQGRIMRTVDAICAALDSHPAGGAI